MSVRKRKRIQLVAESEARGRTADIFREVREVLGISFVPEVYRAWAAYPQFLELHWELLKPVLATQDFFSLADRLRADAYTRAHNYFEVPDLSAAVDASEGTDARHQAQHAIELLHYLNPVLLLVLAAQLQALEAPVGQGRRGSRPAVRPRYSQDLVVPESEDASVRKVFDQMRRLLDLAHLDMEYRALARWPQFLLHYWQALRPLVELPVYPAAHWGIRESAWTLTRELPGVVDLPDDRLRRAHMQPDEIANVARLTSVFFHNGSLLALNLALAKIALEGGNRVQPARKEPEAVAPSPQRGVA